MSASIFWNTLEGRSAKADFAGYESERQTLTVYPPHPEEGANTCAFGTYRHSVAPVSKDGVAHRSRVYPTSASNVRKSGKPDLRCSRRRARGCGIRVGPRLRLLTMRAERNRVCVQLIGIRFNDSGPRE